MMEVVFAGKFRAALEFHTAIGNAGEALAMAGTNIGDGNRTLASAWDGDAGNAAYNFFEQLARATSQQNSGIVARRSHYDAALQKIHTGCPVRLRR